MAADAQGSMRRAQVALEACEGARAACQDRLEGMGQGSERCWEALEAERVHAPRMLTCTYIHAISYLVIPRPCRRHACMQLSWGVHE